jgi:hypothetical protein
MNWLAQVGHVIANDVRRTRWYLALYVIAVALTMLYAIGPALASFAVLDVGSMVIVAVGLLTLAALVQSDSPSRIDSYWKALPLDPAAVATAKLVLALAVIVLPATGGFVVYAALGAPIGFAAHELGPAAVAFGLCTLAVLVAAALTPDLRTLLLFLLAAIIFWTLLGALFQWVTGIEIEFGHMPPGVPAALTLAVGVATVLVLGFLYRRRDVRWIVWTVAFLFASAAMVSPFFGSVHPRTESPPASPVELSLERGDAGTAAEGSGFQLHVSAVGVPADLRLVLMIDSIAVLPRRGAGAHAYRRGLRVTVQEPSLPLLAGLRWSFAPTQARPLFDPYLKRQRDEMLVTASDIARVDVYGRVEESRLVPVAQMPLRAGASVFASGGRAQVVRVATASDSLRLALRLLTVRSDPGIPFSTTIGDFGSVQLDLVNDAAKEVLPVAQIGMGGGNVPLVMPANLGYDYDVQFRAMTRPGSMGSVDSLPPLAWYDGAHIQLSEYVRLQAQPVHLVYIAGK